MYNAMNSRRIVDVKCESSSSDDDEDEAKKMSDDVDRLAAVGSRTTAVDVGVCCCLAKSVEIKVNKSPMIDRLPNIS
jgi:hypothetical protein